MTHREVKEVLSSLELGLRWLHDRAAELGFLSDAQKELLLETLIGRRMLRMEHAAEIAGQHIVSIFISNRDWLELEQLGRSDAVRGSVHEVLAYVAASLADGVRRPGSWEAQLLPSLFGTWGQP